METFSFGEWVGRRRKALDLTQREMAARVGCATATLKKIEADERRPSRELAGLLAEALRVPPEWRETFVECARGQRSVDALAMVKATQEDGPAPLYSAAAASLPAAASPFIGRGAELAQIAELLAQPGCRLLTLVGTGGIGKTRLAIEAAGAGRNVFSDGVVFVPLADVADAALIPTAIAHRLHLALIGPPDAQIMAYLRNRTMLLVLDNCEQLGEGVAWLSGLLATAPGVKLLVTSRERLQLAEEWVLQVPALNAAQAAELFEQAVRRTRVGFDLGGQQTAVNTICQLVENLPLAIELAAGWTPFMSSAQIAEHIRHDLDFLGAPVRNVPEGHHSLRAVFDRSWNLLSPIEQTALSRLSVFRGGWTADAAEQAAAAGLPILRSLVEKSLARFSGDGRYELHELARKYAAEKLRDAGQEAEARRQHCAAYLALSEQIELQLYGPEAIAGYARFDREQDNYRAALAWALEAGEVEAALKLVNNLTYFWFRRGYWQEAERSVAAAVRQAGDEDGVPLCRALVGLLQFSSFLGHHSEAQTYFERALAMAHRLEDPLALADLRIPMAVASTDPVGQSAAALAESLALLQEWDEPRMRAKIAMVHFLYGDQLLARGHHPEAAAQYQKSLDLYRRNGSVDMVAYPLGNLGRLALQAGRLQEAYDLIAESVSLCRSAGNRVGMADWLHQLGKVALYLGDTAQAEASLQEALALYEEIGGSRSQIHALAISGHVALARGDVAQADRFVHESLSTAQHGFELMPQNMQAIVSPFIRPVLLDALVRAALVAAAQARLERAVTLLGNAEFQCMQNGYQIEPPLQAAFNEAMTMLRAELPEPAFSRAGEAGRSMSLERILAYAVAI